MPVQTWKKFGDKIPVFLEPTTEEIAKTQELLGEDLPLYEKIRTGTLEEKQEARNKLTVKHMGLVYRVVNRFYFLLYHLPTDLAIDRDDLNQEGMLGLMRAIETYDYTKGARFSTYAFYFIRQFIMRYYQNRALSVRIPIHLQEKLREIGKITDSLRIEFGREPNRGEIAEASGITLEEFDRTIEKARMLQHILSLDAPIDDSKDEGEMSLYEAIAGKGESFEEAIEKKEISSEFRKKIWKIFWLVGVEPREQYFLERFFGLDGGERETLQKIGDKQGLTRERVRQIIDKGLSKLQTPEIGKMVQTLFSEYKVPDATPPYPWRRAFKLLKLIADQKKQREEWTPESLLEMAASCFGFKPEQLKKSGKKDEVIEVARSTAVFFLSKICGMSRARLSSFLNVKKKMINVSMARVHEELKIWGREALWVKFQFFKKQVIPEESDPQTSIILNLLQNPEPTYSEIANLLNVSKKVVQDIARKTEIDGILRRREREQSKREKVLEEILNHPEMTYPQIGKMFGLTEGTVKFKARQLGIKRGKGKRFKEDLVLRNREILLAIQQNPDLTYEEIGEMFKLSKRQIGKIARRHEFHRFGGWRSTSTKEGLKTRDQKILSAIRNNPNLDYIRIGKMFGLSKTRVGEIALKNGLTRESGRKGKNITFEQVFKLLQEKKNLRAVAKVLKCSVSTVHNRLREGN